ncbi:PepSY domain-containing protein [Photobacterium iliopiscarium]|uniref:PepSY domain-containing protein n=1 Tax=Photobacterium iliopiscarium TaxID=56192 RepID=UPI002431D711|nr:PepSY domain-containing protein [Photobacterium iliopiscarium]
MIRRVKVLFISSGMCCLLQSYVVHADPVDTTVVKVLSVPSAMKQLESDGYYDFRMIKIERKHNEIAVKARNRVGDSVELEMDLYSGIILHEKTHGEEIQ